jgi:hypothetical protein
MNVSIWKRLSALSGKHRSLMRLMTLAALVVFAAFGWSASAFATHFPVATTLWGYEAGTASRILEYDIGPADAFVSSCTPPGSLNGRGLAFDPTDGNLWYTFVDAAFAGDGFIHKTTPPPACATVTTIPFRDGPGGIVQDDIGAIDVDPDDANLWVAGYHPVGGDSFLYKVDRTTGALIQFCHVPFGGGGVGNDTLTEAKLPGLLGSGSYLLTDAGELSTAPNDLLVVDEATCTGGGSGTIVATYPKAVAMSGIDYETKLIATDGSSIYNLGIPPFAAALAVMSAAPSSTLEDITLKVGPGAPAQLTLAPASATNTVGTTHCVTATVTDQFGTATPGITVRFLVTGSVSTSGSATTSASGQATFCYTGPALPGSDVITAFADTNNNSVKDAGEPSDTATKNWVVPPSTPACNVTYGGRILAANGDKATFGGNAMVPASGPQGQEQYQDHGAAANLNVHSINVLAVTCSADGKSASIFGTATINGSGSVNYRIDMTDNGEPGAGSDTYRIRLSSGYDSGEQTLIGGNIQLH